MNTGQKILLSFLAGVGVGAVAGLLIAPDSGKETRKKLAQKAGDIKSSIGTQMTKLTDKVNELTKKNDANSKNVEAKTA